MFGSAARFRVARLAVVTATIAATIATPAQAVDKTFQFLASDSWNSSLNWSPFGIPTTDDVVFIDDENAVTLSADTAAVNGLTISDGGELHTSGFQVTVSTTNAAADTVTIIEGVGSRIVTTTPNVGNRALDVDFLDINSGALLDMNGGRVDVDVDLDINSGGIVVGNGVLRVLGTRTNKLRNSGVIRAEGGTLTVESTDGGDFDLDGTGNGVLEAVDGLATLIIDGAMDLGATGDEFSGTANIGAGNTLQFDRTWATDTGVINFNAAGGTGVIEGAPLNNGGTINANAGVGRILATVFMPSTASVHVAAGAELDMSITTYQGGIYTGDEGSLFRKGTMFVTAPTTFDFPNGTVDFDDGGDDTINADLTINAASVDEATVDAEGYGGTMDIANSATLRVNITGGGSWRLNGRMFYNGNSTPDTFLAGSRLQLSSTAEMNVNGEGATSAELDISGEININDENEDFSLAGGFSTFTATHNMVGGTINGPGELEIPSTSRLIGFGIINADIRANTGSSIFPGGDVLADEGTLDIRHVASADIVGTNSDSGVLNLNTRLFTGNITALELNGGSVTGFSVQNGGVTRGFGTVATIQFVNNGIVRATCDEELIIDNASVTQPDLDGGGSGVLEAIEGNLRIVDLPSDSFTGTANVGPSRSITFEAGWEVDSGGELNLNGGINPITAAVIAGVQQLLGGTVNVDQHARFTAPTTFTSAATINLDDAVDVLNLGGDATIASDATFTGSGRLVNLAGSTLQTEDNAAVGVTLENAGTMTIGSSPGELEVEAFEQASTGVLEIELAGELAGQFDQITVANNANLAGTLDVSLIAPFEPELGDSFAIVETLFGNVVGSFDTTILPVFGDLTLDVIYESQSVLLEVVEVLPGDYNNDEAVDIADYTVWRDNLGAPAGTLPNDTTGDAIGAAQYTLWTMQYAAAASQFAVEPAAVPEPSTLLLLLMASAASFRLTKTKTWLASRCSAMPWDD